MNPLWIISLFLGISELTAGAAATQSTGWVQSAFAAFAVVFPTSVAAAFFAILWKRPYVLYAPADFPRHTSVSTFVDAMRSPSSVDAKMLEPMIKTAIEAALPAMRSTAEIGSEQLDNAIGEAVEAVRREFDANSVYVSLRGIDPDGLGGVAIPIFDGTTVSALLNEIWFHLADYVPAYTYGQTWELVKLDATGAQLAIKSSPQLGAPDNRLLTEVGVVRTDKLVARLLDPQRMKSQVRVER